MSTPQDPSSYPSAPQPAGQPYGDQPYAGQPYGGQPAGAPQAPQYGAQPGYAPQPVAGQKSKIVAGILGILLGAFGVHNFYLGYTGKAVAQLLITVISLGLLSFISAIWGLIEGILILISKPGTSWHQDASGAELQD